MFSSDTKEKTISLTSRQAKAAQAAIEKWTHAKLLAPSLASELVDSIKVEDTFDWQKFAKYSFRLAMLCLAIAVLSIITDSGFQKLIKRILALPAIYRSAATALLAIGVHVWGYQRSQAFPSDLYSNEAIHSLGALLFAVAAFQLGEAIEFKRRAIYGENNGADHDNLIQYLFLLLSLIYFGVGILVKSNFIWSYGWIMFGTWFGFYNGYIPGVYLIGMEDPVRFVLLGLGTIGAASIMRQFPVTAPLWSTTRIWGLLYHFIALWILSTMRLGYLGSKGDNKWLSAVIKYYIWSFSFTVAAVAATWHGLRYGDSTTKGFGLTFLGINLYTKLFETLWDISYKPLFFALLAGSLAVIGRYAENIWNLERLA